MELFDFDFLRYGRKPYHAVPLMDTLLTTVLDNAKDRVNSTVVTYSYHTVGCVN